MPRGEHDAHATAADPVQQFEIAEDPGHAVDGGRPEQTELTEELDLATQPLGMFWMCRAERGQGGRALAVCREGGGQQPLAFDLVRRQRGRRLVVMRGIAVHGGGRYRAAVPGTPPPDDVRTQTLRDQLLALRAFARAQMGAALLARESPSDVVQGVCEDLLRLRESEPAAVDPIGDIGRLRHLIRFKVQERQRYWRRQKRAREATEVEPDRQPAAARGPETMAILREWLIEMRRLVEALPARQRLAVQRFYLDGRTMRQVGEELECSEDAAKMLVARGMATLRERQGRRST